jgi:hypothetical protein
LDSQIWRLAVPALGALVAALVVVAAHQLVAGPTFVLDGC